MIPIVSSAKVTDTDNTVITSSLGSDSSGYSTIGATATKSYPQGPKTFKTESLSIIFKSENKIKSITSKVFHKLTKQIAEYENDTFNKNENYTIKDFEFVYPVGLKVPSVSLSASKKEQERAELKQQNQQNLETSSLYSVDSEQIKNSTPDDLKAKGLARLSEIIFDLGKQIPILIIPPLLNIINEYISDQAEEYCPSPEELDKIIKLRNTIVGQLNNLSSKLDQTGSALTGISNFLNIILTTVQTIDIASIVLSLATKFVPLVPGAVASSLNDAQTFIRKVTFNEKGESKLSKTNSIINTSSLSLAIVSSYILIALKYITRIDALINKCKEYPELDPLSPQTKSIAQIQELAEQTLNQSTYQGFLLEIEEVPFSPTVNRYKAVGKNQYGITVISSELSFTSNPQILIDEVKFIIDRDNLKAY